MTDDEPSPQVRQPTWCDATAEDHDNNDCVDVHWCFGPQGHPASLRVQLSASDDGAKVSTTGPLILETLGESHAKNLGSNLRRLIAFGEKIEKRFGKDCRWHYCTPGCKQWTGDAPPYKRCEKCDETRKTAEREALEFFERVKP